VRRAARFVIGWIRLRLKGILALARNLARVIVGRIGDVFAVAGSLVRALPHIWSFLTRRPVGGSDPRHLTVLTDADFDLLLVQHPSADPARVTALGRRLRTAAGLFAAVAALVNRLISAFVRVSRRIALGGWFGVALTLLRARAWLAEMRALAARVITGLAELNALAAPSHSVLTVV